MKAHPQSDTQSVISLFVIPSFVAASILGFVVLGALHLSWQATMLITTAIFVGSIDLLKDTINSLIHRKFALDYIALLAISVGVASGELLVAAVIVLMLAGGQTLEKYAVTRAKKSLTALIDRIPSDVHLWENGDVGKKVHIADVIVGQEIVVRKGEVIPLDGLLVSLTGLVDESSLTGEPYENEKLHGDQIRSGTVNIGGVMVIAVTHADADSTYRKIVEMVRRAQDEQTPLIRIADRYSTVFTFITLALAGFAYIVSGGNFHQVLAVLVIATPCPLILATPIALIGGMSAMAKQKIIVKNLASIEVLSRVSDIMFDKTGTITLGKPQLTDVDVSHTSLTKHEVLAIADAIERNSLHPLAKAVVAAAKANGAKRYRATNIEEKIGVGISGTVQRRRYMLAKAHSQDGFAIALMQGAKRIALIHFEDTIKKDSESILGKLKISGLRLSIFTGDKRQAAEKIVSDLHMDITVKAECTPEDKMNGIKHLRGLGGVTAMVGDGINDAPAVAAADVGMVFSSGEHTAASEAADLVFLGGDLSGVLSAYMIAKRTLNIALQSIVVGIGLSVIGMTLASFGMIPPLMGAVMQEAIDIAVILNALRTSA